MKKIASLVIVSFFTMMAFSQKSHTEFGLKGGVNLANVQTNTTNTDLRTGWHAGALAHIHLSPAFALQPEVMYSAQGAKLSNNVQKINYVNVPVLGQYMFGNGFRIQSGPQIGYLVSSKAKSGHTEVNVTDAYKKADFSWSFGAGYVSRSGLGIDARYNLGINDISKNNSDVRNRVWQVGLFYQFRH